MFRLFRSSKGQKTPGRQFVDSTQTPDRFIDLYQRFFSKNSPQIVFDIGANVGLISQKFRDMFPHSTIHAFEPTPEAFRKLSWRFRKDTSFVGNNVAVTNQGTIMTFYVNNKFNKVNSLLPRNKKIQAKYSLYDVQQSIEVNTTTIDDYCIEKDIAHIDILKLDIQGGELLAMQGAKEMLETQRVDLILAEVLFIELYEGCPLLQDLSSFLSKRGYNLYCLYDLHRGKDGQLMWGDGIFIKKGLI